MHLNFLLYVKVFFVIFGLFGFETALQRETRFEGILLFVIAGLCFVLTALYVH